MLNLKKCFENLGKLIKIKSRSCIENLFNFIILRYLVVFHSRKKVGLGSCYLQKYDYYGQNVKAVDDKSKFTSVANFEEVDLLW